MEWDQATQRITSRKGRVTLVLRLGDSTMTRTDLLEGTATIALDTAPFAVNNRTLVPVRAVSEGLGAAVDWDGAAHTVTITAPENVLEEYPLGGARLVLPGYGSPRLERDGAAGTEYLYWASELLCLEATAYPFPQKISLWDLDRETQTLDGYVRTLAAGGEDTLHLPSSSRMARNASCISSWWRS